MSILFNSFLGRQRKQKWTENAQARRERNRKSARESRLRKKNFVQGLEEKVNRDSITPIFRLKNWKLKLKDKGLLLKIKNKCLK